jgi:hypothetical protein
MSGTLSPGWWFCAPQMMVRSPRPSLTRQTESLSEFGHLVAGEDLRDHDALELAGELLDAFDFEPEHGEALRELLGRPVEVHVLLEPVLGDFHFR